MKRWRRILVLVGLAAALSACGLLNTLIPPVENPLGLDGVEVALDYDGPAALRLAPQAAETFSGSIDATTSDLTDAPLDPRSLTTDLGFSSVVLEADATTTAAADFAAEITVESISFTMTVNDDATASPVTVGPFTGTELGIGFAKGTCTDDGVTVACPYSPVSSALEGIEVSISGDDFAALFAVFTNDSEPNVVGGPVSITIDPSVPAGTQVAIATLETTAGQITAF